MRKCVALILLTSVMILTGCDEHERYPIKTHVFILVDNIELNGTISEEDFNIYLNGGLNDTIEILLDDLYSVYVSIDKIDRLIVVDKSTY